MFRSSVLNNLHECLHFIGKPVNTGASHLFSPLLVIMVAVHNLLEVGNDKGVAGSAGSQLNQFIYLFYLLITIIIIIINKSKMLFKLCPLKEINWTPLIHVLIVSVLQELFGINFFLERVLKFLCKADH